jgi:hypothetical protein
MKDIIGLAVLTSPLFLIIAWLPVSFWLALKLAKRIAFKNGAVRLVAGLSGFVLIFMLPFADEIAGQIYFSHLCGTEAGVKVYQTVELPAEYWDEKGKPKFFNDHGRLDHELMKNKLDGFDGRVERVSSFFAIDKNIHPIKEKSSQKLLAEVTTFGFWGGWISRNFSPHNTATSCDFMDAPNFHRNFYGRLFKPATTNR